MLELEVISQRLHLLSEYVLFWFYDFWNWLLTLNYTTCTFPSNDIKSTLVILAPIGPSGPKTRYEYIQCPTIPGQELIALYHLCSELFLPTFIFYKWSNSFYFSTLQMSWMFATSLVFILTTFGLNFPQKSSKLT